MPGFDNPGSDTPYGYGFQWWTPSHPRGDFMASGIYHQFIYIDPTTNIIIAKTSANQGYTDPKNKLQKDETITAFQQIAEKLAASEWHTFK